jgi:4-amino-4-deoxy-L-arabinose transferase-like glycosyltransferase
LTKQPRSFHIILLIFFALIVSSVVLFNTLCNGDFHGDESGWISSGYYYTELLLHRDWDGDKWECPTCLTWGGINMNLGKWMIGIPLKVYQMRTGRYFQGYYEFKSPLEDNLKKGLVPPRDILLIARSIPAVFGVLCCLLVFLIGYLIYNEWGGLVAALLTIGNHLFVTYSTKAMTDAFYNFFLLSSCLAGIFFVKATTLKNRIITTILGAVFTGLACSIKITGITVGFIFFSCLIIYMFCMGRDRVSQALLLLIGFCLSCLLVVWALNPYFWPIVSQDSRTQAMLEKSQQVENKNDIYSNLILDSLKQHSSLMNSRIMQFPRMFFRWRNVYLQLKKSGSDWWLEARFTTLNRHLFVFYSTFWGSFFFLGVGIVWTFQRLLASLKTKKIDPCAVALVYFLANYLFILAFMVLNWERYYLPTLLAGNILTAAGILQLAVWGYTGTIRLVRNLAK